MIIIEYVLAFVALITFGLYVFALAGLFGLYFQEARANVFRYSRDLKLETIYWRIQKMQKRSIIFISPFALVGINFFFEDVDSRILMFIACFSVVYTSIQRYYFLYFAGSVKEVLPILFAAAFAGAPVYFWVNYSSIHYFLCLAFSLFFSYRFREKIENAIEENKASSFSFYRRSQRSKERGTHPKTKEEKLEAIRKRGH